MCAALSKSRTLSAPPPKKLEKQRLISGFLKSLSTPDAAIAARFLSGYVFAAHDERTLGIGGTNLFRVIAETAGQPSHNLGTAYRKHGDLGDMAEELLRSTNAKGDLALPEVAQLFEELAAARGQSQKAALLRNAFQSASAGDVKYIVKIITGDLRIGSKESLVEEAIAKAFDRPLEEVRRANMLTGDIGETLTTGKRLALRFSFSYRWLSRSLLIHFEDPPSGRLTALYISRFECCDQICQQQADRSTSYFSFPRTRRDAPAPTANADSAILLLSGQSQKFAGMYSGTIDVA